MRREEKSTHGTSFLSTKIAFAAQTSILNPVDFNFPATGFTRLSFGCCCKNPLDLSRTKGFQQNAWWNNDAWEQQKTSPDTFLPEFCQSKELADLQKIERAHAAPEFWKIRENQKIASSKKLLVCEKKWSCKQFPAIYLRAKITRHQARNVKRTLQHPIFKLKIVLAAQISILIPRESRSPARPIFQQQVLENCLA